MARIRRINKALDQAIVRTVNRLLQRGRTEISKRTRQTYNIKAGDLKAGTRIYRATRGQAEGKLVIKGAPQRLIKFAGAQRPAGVPVRIRKDRGRQIIKSAFIATMPSGYIQVFQRKGKSRLPIESKFTISVSQMAGPITDEVFKELIDKEAGPQYQRNLDYYLGRA